jgi:dTDP-4-dehydrorhamnose reductase
MKILITGAGGFLGQYLTRTMTAQHEVTGVSKQQLNLANTSAVAEFFSHDTYDAVINCAATGRYTPMSEDAAITANNLASIINLVTAKEKYRQLINIGTGAEFDLSQDINNASESEIYNRNPKQSYGLSKNIIARYLETQPNCYTMRLFGCFDSSEDSNRLFKKLHSVVAQRQTFEIEDRMFDTISAKDFGSILSAVIDHKIHDQNINCVYAKKYRLSEILSVYCNKHNLDAGLIKIKAQGLNYTGNGNVLSKYNVNLQGLEQALTEY